MSLYETLFSSRELEASQFLVTQTDIEDETRRKNLDFALSQILDVGMIPIINENDAVSANKGYDVADSAFSDNDGLAALIANLCGARLLILLSDVRGLYDRPPNDPGARLISTCTPSTTYELGEKSERGRGGMKAKIASAFRALDMGVQYVALASGHEPGVILKLVDGTSVVGTVFTNRDEDDDEAISSSATTAIETARAAREAGRVLQSRTAEERSEMLLAIAKALEEKSEDILRANDRDMSCAVAEPLRQRLGLSQSKITTLANGARALATTKDPVHQLLEKRELSEGLILEKRATPLGVVLVIFESRPDALVQISCLAIRAGCALVLKGGKEAKESNAFLKRVIDEAVEPFSSPIFLLETRQAIDDLLAHPESTSLVDLVVPRGSNQLVRHIQSSTKIPVLGHADGICHAYVHEDADFDKAVEILVDSKTDYPAACNALETTLISSKFPRLEELVAKLKESGITLLGGRASSLSSLRLDPADSLSHEYGDLTMLVELVDSLEDAISFVNENSSSHTDTILTESDDVAQKFQRQVDSACVHHNASTRFSDGFRYGLGAELGVATGRLHARGPVGINGFLTYKWLLTSNDCHTQTQFMTNLKKYTHKDIYP